MPGYQQYNKYRVKSEDRGFKYGKILILVAILVVVYLIGKAIFGGGSEVESVLPTSNTNVNESTSIENTNSELINENDNSNTNESTNSNENTNIEVDTSAADSFDISQCNSLYSRGATDQKKVSLTFNIGTTKEGEVQKVLDSLTGNKIAADFFARGDVAEGNPDLINKIDSAGFAIHNLSYNHPNFNDLPSSAIVEQLANAEDAITQRTGKTTKPFFRPPYGSADEDVVAAVTEAGYCPVSWSVDAMDWSTEYTAEESKQRVLDNIGNGSIVLMQAGNSVTADIVPSLISELKDRGYQIVTLDELLK